MGVCKKNSILKMAVLPWALAGLLGMGVFAGTAFAGTTIKIASLVIQGKTEEANNVKKQLPFRTLTANYRERRLAYII